MKRLKVHPISSTSWKFFWEKYFRHRPFNRESRLQRIIAIGSLVFRSPFYLLESLIFDRRLAKHPIEEGPIFVIGHWRSGTTHLHNILSQDKRFSYLSFSNMVMPHDMLLGRFLPVIPLIMKLALPKTRGIDKLPLSPHLPQEEELSLGMLSGDSYYNCYFYPQHWDNYFTKVIPEAKAPGPTSARIEAAYLKLVRKLSYLHKGKQLIFKNPASTSRIEKLKELFPTAKFIHIRRNPYAVFASSRARLPRMVSAFSLNDDPGLDYEKITINSYRDLMSSYFKQRENIPTEDLLETSFEELEADPEKVLSEIYSKFGLERSDECVERHTRYLEGQKSYQKNTHRLTRSQIESIRSEWGFALEEWHYELPEGLEIVE